VDLNLRDKVAIVTGASRGLGRAAAEALLTEDVRVLAVARDAQALGQLVTVFPDRVLAATCDMRDADAVRRLPDLALEGFGRLDIIVNNAGIAPAAHFADQSWATWDEVLSVNVTAPAVLTQAAGRRFLDQGAGKVINIVSTSGLRGKPGLVAYSTSKGALIRFTEALGAEWAAQGVQVNAIAPGAFATDAQHEVTSDPELLARRVRKIPARRMGQPHEFGPVVTFLASAASDFISGATFVIDGGEVSKL
jgi:2-dehydro-3-deoxy-D-gluconate 5-dehydrogenase